MLVGPTRDRRSGTCRDSLPREIGHLEEGRRGVGRNRRARLKRSRASVSYPVVLQEEVLEQRRLLVLVRDEPSNERGYRGR